MNAMNARHAAWLASVLSTALLGAGCDKPTDTMARRSETPMTPPTSMAPAAPASNAADRAAVAVDDTALTANVKAALIAEPGLKSMPIEVSTKNSVVTLTGTVESAVDKAKALQVTETVQGVKSVVDNLSAKS